VKFCQPCFQKLKDAFAARGLHSTAIAPPGAGPGPKTADLLLQTSYSFYAHAVETVGLGILLDNDDGSERCPACFLVANCSCGRGDACHYKSWADGMADMALRSARKGTA
jgi:hypothetical protein